MSEKIKMKKAKKGKIKSHKYMTEIEIGDTCSGEYYVKERNYDKTINGDTFTKVSIGDKSGFKDAVGWEKFEINPGYVKAIVKANEYKGKISYIISSIENIDEPSDDSVFDIGIDNIDSEIETLIGSIRKSEEKLKVELENCKPVMDMLLKIYNECFDTDEDIKAYGLLPYTEDSVYGKKGGVAKRINILIKFVENMENIYELGCVESHCLKISILIHLIGCFKCYEIKDCASLETKHGKLYGFEKSTLMSLDRLVSENIHDIGTYDRIVHCISSQYPHYKFKPKTLEAIIFSKVTSLDDEVTHAIHCINNDSTESEFTAFDWSNRKQYYKS